MISQYFPAVALIALAIATVFQQFDGCRVEPDEWTECDDGDNMQELPEHIAEEW